MSSAALLPPVWVDTPKGLAHLAAVLAAQSVIAVDTESNSLHAYRERVCLIQFSTVTADYLLDPLALPDLSALAPPMADPAIEKIFHASEYDLICLRRDFGWKVKPLFDTMVAARTLGLPQMGLAALLETYFDVKMNKRHQRADWAQRPLLPDQVDYARMDTHFLIPLRARLAEQLQARGCWAEAAEEFERLTQMDGAAAAEFGAESFWRVSGARDLTPRQAAILRELYIYRESVARRLDRPPFKVMSEATLMALAQATVHTANDLKAIPGMTDGQIRRHGAQIVQAVARGRQASVQPPPRAERHDDALLDRYDRLRRWRKQRAQERGVESDVIMPREVLWALAGAGPQSVAELERVTELGPVRRAKYGQEIIEVLSKKGKHGA